MNLLLVLSKDPYIGLEAKKTGYGDLAVWIKDFPPVEAEITKNIELADERNNPRRDA